MTKSDVMLILLAVAYVIVPVDFVPELLTGPLGLTDDMAAIALIVATVMRARNREQAEPAVVPVTPTYRR